MLTPFGILLLVAGAALTFAVTGDVDGVDLQLVGWILMAGGASALMLAIVRLGLAPPDPSSEPPVDRHPVDRDVPGPETEQDGSATGRRARVPSVVGRDGTTVVLEAATSQVSAARRFVRQAVDGRVPDDVAADLQLIVSELFTNAVQYGASSHVTVTVEIGPDDAGVTVDSGSPAPDVGPIESWQVAEETEISGRGLGIVRRIADVVRVERDTQRFAVAAWRTFSPHGHRAMPA